MRSLRSLTADLDARSGVRIETSTAPLKKGIPRVIKARDPETSTLVGELKLRSTTNGVTTEWVEVDYSRRGTKVAQALYRRAAELACAQGLTVRSDVTRSEAADAFWKKQVRAGHAVAVAGRGTRYNPDTGRAKGKLDVKHYELLCPPRELAGVKALKCPTEAEDAMTERNTRTVRGLGELTYDMRQPCGLPFERFRTKLRFKDGYEWIAFRKNQHGEDTPGRPSAATIARQLSRAKRWLFAEYQQSCEPHRVAGPSRTDCAPVCAPKKSKPCGDACVPLDAECKTRRKRACSFEEAFGRFEAPTRTESSDDDDFDFSDDAEPFTLFGLGGSSCPHAKRFHQLTNMTPAQIRKWAKDPRSKLASEASTRARLPKLAALKAKPVEKWTPADCKFAARVVSFNSRMDGMRKEHGCTTKIDVSLRNWGRRAPGCQTARASAGRVKA